MNAVADLMQQLGRLATWTYSYQRHLLAAAYI
jgi:hypothetical protein